MTNVISIAELSPSAQQELFDLRHALHREPELSFQEHRTAERLEAALRAAGLKDVRRVADTGVIGIAPGTDRSAPTVCIRGDIDALPIQEATGLPFASINDGVMHACGHDVHATWAVGAGRILVENPARSDVMILLQPAEETGQGASAVLETGVLDGVAAIFGAHVDRRFTVGQVVADTGPVAAAADTFTVELIGSGAHGARPHEGRDPVVGAAALITALQTIVARQLNPADAGVVSVGSIHGGSAPNVIPDRVSLSGTLRAVTPDVRTTLHEAVRRVADHIARAHRLEAVVQITHGTPPIVNASEPIAWARQAIEETLGAGALTPLGFLNMGGEDFAYYLEKIPGCFLRIGARNQGEEATPAHTPGFFAAEECIMVGAAVLARTARIASETLS